jgi:hypothetical protein
MRLITCLFVALVLAGTASSEEVALRPAFSSLRLGLRVAVPEPPFRIPNISSRVTISSFNGREFEVSVLNDLQENWDLAGDWQLHHLIIDGKHYEVMQTEWWCIQSSLLQPGKTYSRPMHLNYYPGAGLATGVHRVQLQIGSQLSNVLEVTVPKQF